MTRTQTPRKLVEIYPALPANITAADTYEIVQPLYPRPSTSGSAWRRWAMKHLYQYGLGYPKGNTDWGKDAGRPAERDLRRGGRTRCALDIAATRSPGVSRRHGADLMEASTARSRGSTTSSGTPGSGSTCSSGTTDHTIDAEYPGAGSACCRPQTATSRQLYAPTKDGNRSLAQTRSPAGNGWLLPRAAV